MARIRANMAIGGGGTPTPTATTINKVVFSSSSTTYTVPSDCLFLTIAFTANDNNYMPYFKLNGKAADIYQDNGSNGGTATWFNVSAGEVMRITSSSFTVHIITFS